MRLAVIDFETTGFSGDYNDLLAIGWKDLYKDKIEILRIDDFNKHNGIWTDELMIREFMKIVKKYHVLIGHYIKNFDVKFLRGRCLQYGLSPFTPGTGIIDTWSNVKGYAKLSRYRLEAVAESVGIEPIEVAESMYIDPRVIKINAGVWKRALQLDKKALDFVSDHCRVDIAVNTQAYWKLCDVMIPKMQKMS